MPSPTVEWMWRPATSVLSASMTTEGLAGMPKLTAWVRRGRVVLWAGMRAEPLVVERVWEAPEPKSF